MKICHMVFALLLALSWAPLTSHCQWETFVETTLQCCPDDSPQPRDCDGDICASLEGGIYKTQEERVSILPPVLAPLFLAQLILENPSSATRLCRAASINALPEEWPRIELLTLRTALPPRAPSLDS